MMASPWWTYIIIAGIILSGYMFTKHSREEYRDEQQFIEQEGEVYMKRLAEEKKRREKASS
ncbi:sporulation YhaL family protein [Anaerobacillus sp. MEB173]|uniref:sporulation YhaL family protein n=1 Tax=Anaerobacillus sp. MEB173 TaxID=3383345 RepID=UPI003F9092A6